MIEQHKLDALSRSRIARQIYKAAESMGISDRDETDEITRQVLERIDEAHEKRKLTPLPGWEEFVADSPTGKDKNRPDDLEIQAILKDVVAARKKPPAAAPEPVEIIAPQEPEKPEEKIVITADTPATAQTSAKSGMDITENSRRVLEKRYLKRDNNDKPTETAEDMLHRVAKTISQAELIYNPKANVKAAEREFYQVMERLEFLPNSPTMMNAGRELGQLSACFVLPIEDSMESIFDAVKYTALIHKSGGGTGFSFSRLRPENDRVGSTGGVASGPISFMKAFDAATDVIKQGGMRRGANMGILNVDHPDIEKFIHSKEDMKSLQNFNISVAVTTAFMEAVKKNADYDLINPHSHEVVGKLNAKKVFDQIVQGAWATGDPGIIFIDNINKKNPTPNLGKIESTNPCGEQPLLPNESCNLGSINLARMLKRSANGKVEFDYAHLAKVTRTAIHFLDNVIDVNHFPLPQIKEATLKTRKIGLGVMGYADMLLEMGIPYNSDEAVTLGGNIMKAITDEARRMSSELAETRGVFPAYKGSIYEAQGIKVRNAAVTTIAPTGTISIIAGVSSGIEPLFALSYTRNIMDGAQLVEVNPAFEKAAKERGFYSPELMKKLATGTQLHTIADVPDDIKKVFVTAHEIGAEWHVKTQAAFQNYVDNAVSKTVNFPHDATPDDVRNVYLMAYDYDLKGITIYRDGSRDAQVLTTKKEETKDKVNQAVSGKLTPRDRPEDTKATVTRVNTGCGHIYVTVAFDDVGICEVFLALGHSGGCSSAQLEAVGRLISMSLRAGVDVVSIIKQLRGIRCSQIVWEKGRAILSCADAIAGVLAKYIPPEEVNGEAQISVDKIINTSKEIVCECPDCGSALTAEEGCLKCHSCGYSKCN